MQKHRKHWLLIALAAVCACLLGYFFAFTQMGEFLTLRLTFDQVRPGVYFDRSLQSDRDEVLRLIDEAQARVEGFFGELEARPMIAVSDDEATLGRLGWTGNPALTSTYVLFGARSYVLIAPKGLGVDVIAHELTHAELHARMYRDKPFLSGQLFPIWFDEGLALQNDYRPAYSEAAWSAAVSDKSNLVHLDELRTGAQFYAEDKNQKHLNYLVSRHEVSSWLESHGVAGLKALIEGVNSGRSFSECYAALDGI